MTDTTPRPVLRITGDRDKVRARSARRVGRAGGTVPGAPAVSGQRVRVTRTDVGSPNARVAATASERAPHGAVNTHSGVTDRNADGTRYRPGAFSPMHDGIPHTAASTYAARVHPRRDGTDR